MGSIGPVLRRLEIELLLKSVKLIRDCPPDTPDRIDEARRMLRRVLVEHSLGKVTEEVRAEVVEMLSFAKDEHALAATLPQVRLTQPLEPTDETPRPECDPDLPGRHGV